MDWLAWTIVAVTGCIMTFMCGWAFGWTRGYRLGLWRGTKTVGDALNEAGYDELGAVTLNASRVFTK